jgi:hypothetical protein
MMIDFFIIFGFSLFVGGAFGTLVSYLIFKKFFSSNTKKSPKPIDNARFL